MKQLVKIISIAIVCILGTTVWAKPSALTFLTSEAFGGVSYRLILKGTRAVLVETRIPNCFMAPCPPPKVTERDVKLVITDDQIAKDGPKIISLGKGYTLEIAYRWGETSKSYTLLLPYENGAHEQRALDMALSFDVENSRD